MYDGVGRQTAQYIDHPDEEVTVEMTYGPDGQVVTLLAKNPATGDQLTRYVFGTTLIDGRKMGPIG